MSGALHCGACSQCIDRRFAVLAAGAADADPEKGYRTRLLVGERDDGESRMMLASYVETANEVSRMGAVEFFSKFGEVSRVLQHLNGSPEATALSVYDLYKKHAQQVTDVVDQAISVYAKAIRERSLPSSCLLRLVCDASAAGAGAGERTAVEATQRTAPLAKNVFKRKAQEHRAWQVRFNGGKDFILLRSKGAAYLHILLSNPREHISAAKLASMVAGRPEEYMVGSAGEASDREAMAAYRARHEELEEEMREARRDNAGLLTSGRSFLRRQGLEAQAQVGTGVARLRLREQGAEFAERT